MTKALQKALDLYPAPPTWEPGQGLSTKASPEQQRADKHALLLRTSLLSDEWSRMVRAFRLVMQRRVPAEPLALTPEQKQHHAMLLLSEVQEFNESASVVDQADGLLDIIYVALGGLVELGLSDNQIIAGFAEVHASNMTKVQDNGTPLINDGHINAEEPIGKVLKTHNYIRPALAEAMSLPTENA